MMKFLMKMIYIFIIIIFTAFNCIAKQFISNIFIERLQVFDSTYDNWKKQYDIINSLHLLTKQYVIEDELLFKENDEINLELLYETERNLRASDLFSRVKIEIDSISPYYSDVYIITQDKWSTIPILIFGTGGNSTNIGTGLEELNFLGTGTHIRAEAFHRSENNIGWQGAFKIKQQRFLRTNFLLDFFIQANKFRTDQYLLVNQPFKSKSTPFSYGINLFNVFGKDFLYNNGDKDYELMPIHEKKLQLWFSKSWLKEDRVFITSFLELQDVNRGKPQFSRAFDNSGKFLISFSSLSDNYLRVKNLNTYQTEDLPVGGWGTAVLGKIFPIGNKGQSFYYVAGQGEKSWYYDNLYLFAQLTGAGAFRHSEGLYTYQEFLGKVFWQFDDKTLIASRVRQQTVWNWSELRQLILDNDSGLRGYPVNSFTGDNRLIFNTEFRYFPDWNVWIFKISPVAFWDVGTVWNQNTKLNKTIWHNSAGLGIRFFNMKGHGEDSIFRLDFAFNFDEMKFGGIIFTTNQLFSIFEKHQFKLPELFGTEFDYQ